MLMTLVNPLNLTLKIFSIMFHLLSILIPHIKFQDPICMQSVLNEQTDGRTNNQK